MSCKNVPICLEQYSYPFNYCKICQEEIEDAAIRSFKNMGTPERAMCGGCGIWYEWSDFLEHPCVLKNLTDNAK